MKPSPLALAEALYQSVQQKTDAIERANPNLSRERISASLEAVIDASIRNHDAESAHNLIVGLAGMRSIIDVLLRKTARAHPSVASHAMIDALVRDIAAGALTMQQQAERATRQQRRDE